MEWTSDRPFGVGTTRTVIVGRQTIEEYFLAWEPGRRMNFRFDRTTLPFAAFAEDYLVVATGDSTSELHWSYAFEWRGPVGVVAAPLFARIFTRKGEKALARLATLMSASGDRFGG